MKYELTEFMKDVYKFFSNRILILFVAFCIALYALCGELYDLQIVNGHLWAKTTSIETEPTEIDISAPRGNIYDRYGRELAINQTEFSINIDASVAPDDQIGILLRFVELMDANGESIDNVLSNFPITNTEPHEYSWSGTGTNFNRWSQDMGVTKKEMDLDEDPDANKVYDYLLKYFKIPKDIDSDTAYKVLALRSAIFMNRISLEPIVVSVGVKDTTVAIIEERNQDFLGIYVDVDYLRVYPEGELVSHIVGYLGSITEDEYTQYSELGRGYTASDTVGRTGLENAFELQLRGTLGNKTVYANSTGQRVGSSDEKEPTSGNNLYSSIDLDLQKASYEAIENMLTKILLARLKTSTASEYISARDLLSSMVTTNNISIDKILKSESSGSLLVRQYVESNADLDKEDDNYSSNAKKFVGTAISDGGISTNTMLLVLYEQGIVTMTDEEYTRATVDGLSAQDFLIGKVTEGEITPQKTGLEPCTGTLVVVDVNTGEVLAAPNYPSYDNNQFVNTRNSEYIVGLNNDPTSPQVNRAFSSPRAPGSTFKMITAIAGLEEGVISPSTLIYDKGTFTEAGSPYPKCMIASRGGTHGSINVASALSVSCNYFFFQTSWLLGDDTTSRIETLNKYMEMFGLNDDTGVEIGGYSPTPEGVKRISSPEYREYVITQRAAANGTEASASDIKWTDGYTVRTAIGQADNNYTAASMAKYIATLANGGTRYTMTLVDKITDASGNTVLDKDPVVELELGLQQENLDIVYEGMKMVTSSSTGTARSVFSDFPIEVAGKTGTTQQSELDHSSFACFAPYDDPQIAVYVVIPYGNTSLVSSVAANVGKDVLTAYFGLNTEADTSSHSNILIQ